MNDSNDGIWLIIGLAATSALFGIGLWGASHFIAEFGSSVVIPIY